MTRSFLFSSYLKFAKKTETVMREKVITAILLIWHSLFVFNLKNRKEAHYGQKFTVGKRISRSSQR
jgi:hypothetical protein